MDVHGQRRQGVLGRITLAVLALLIGASAGAAGNNPFYLTTDRDEIKIMSYNVLNLFDNVHDEGKSDWTFLPINHPLKKECAKMRNPWYREACEKVDWTPERIQIKLGQIKNAISYQGPLPDILAVQEIENANITGMLAKELGYKHFLVTDSPDGRGIDVALLYNDDKIEYIEHEEIDATAALNYPVRNILLVHFRPRTGRILDVIGVYVNHWPAQMISPIKRVETARVLARAIDQQTTKVGKDNYKVIALGDFNLTQVETPNAFHHVITNPYWANAMIDIQDYSEVRRSPYRYQMPPGSYWISGIDSWRRLDRFAVSQNLVDESGMHVIYDSFRIVGPPEMTKPKAFSNRSSDFYATSIQVPDRANPMADSPKDAGYSDHFPIVMKVKFTANPNPKKPKELDETN
ncbi:MAG: hypothetical protein KDD43_01280 [Bdellovibrionales bacterium]|nr:hypothetical protein [Bdellovibrionales bacterium]